MKTYTLKSRSDRIIWTGEAGSTKNALLTAISSVADLCDADLRGADLCDAALSGADLRDVDLCDADLRDADLYGVDLRGADLRGANLNGANLNGANLRGADLRGADLRDVDLCDADLRGVDLRDVDLRGENIPTIPSIDSAILAAISAKGCSLNMEEWHQGGTTHCRGGWAIFLAGEAGQKLEEAIGPHVAAALIYSQSRKSGKVPDFFASNDVAMADLKAGAAEEMAVS